MPRIKVSQKIIYLLFFISGCAGLMYEIIWGRMLVLIFGSTTNSIVAVVSAFLGGLALGSFLLGNLADSAGSKKLIKTYSILEFGVGLSALATLFLFPAIKDIYRNFSDGSNVSLGLLSIKFLFAAVTILIPTSLMGGTLPILVKFAESQSKNLTKSLSLLYAINTLGGVLGVLLSAFVLIELLGLQETIILAAGLNFAVALLAQLIQFKNTPSSSLQTNFLKVDFSHLFNRSRSYILIAFFLSGFISIAYQILWTRLLTPALGTVIYAFATILSVYIFGIALGSLLYERFENKIPAKNLLFGLVEAGIGFFAILSILVMHKTQVAGNWELTLRILPVTILLGVTFPLVISLLQPKKDTGRILGLGYGTNTLGAILGGFAASFVLIPLVGSSQSVVALGLINLLIGLFFILREGQIKFNTKIVFEGVVLLFFLTSSFLVLFKGDRLFPFELDFEIAEAKLQGIDYSFKEDDVASVLGTHNVQKNLVDLKIDGVSTTHKTVETRLMAHIPIALHPHPQKVLVIAFGMGTSFRSSLKDGMKTDAIELVPSVPPMMPLFHPDAKSILESPNGRVIINDGRNYAFLTNQKYDIVIIDPPPPFNTAGSTVLHSKEFYQNLAKDLNPDGIVSQWIYYYRSREDDISMAIKSYIDVFPFVLAIQKEGPGSGGLYMEGSFSPIDPNRLKNLYDNPVVVADVKEVVSQNPEIEIVGNQKSLATLFGNSQPIVDDHPRTEYYFLRHQFTSSSYLVNEQADAFIAKLKTVYNQRN